MRNGIFIILVATILSSCGGYKLVNKGKEIEVGNSMFTTPFNDWNSSKDGDVVLWTMDGPMLQQIIFVKGAEDGDYLIPVRVNGTHTLDKKVPKFKKDMTSIEVVELFESTFKRLGAQNLEISNVRPYEAAKTKGFRFEFGFLTKDGLAKSGSTYGILKNKRLFMVIYSGANIHYYDKGKEDFEGIVRSLRIL
ncbi:MAG: hypothetical protein HOL37_07980 [Rhodospirillaceae bacterium]|jgi:hypothetical protein|nr:hypothetical protein [Rhodospirillaceae bacterium]MBT4218597.1 hypothetical protein [Rhodospirillaceae bacterium]MBT5309258.1 hypothetical protein [Rhodospirillaceae bacterium]MBT7355005.1 hypothetical protein [Rhodospirillaceae bacterium]